MPSTDANRQPYNSNASVTAARAALSTTMAPQTLRRGPGVPPSAAGRPQAARPWTPGRRGLPAMLLRRVMLMLDWGLACYEAV